MTSAEQCCGDVVYRTDVMVPLRGGVRRKLFGGEQTCPVDVHITTNDPVL